MEYSEIFTNFLTAISPALQQLVTALVIAALSAATLWIKAKFDTERARLSQEQKYLLDLIVSNAVRSAEQVYTDNAEKRKHALEIAQAQLAQYGLKIELSVVAAAIEAAVFNMKNDLLD